MRYAVEADSKILFNISTPLLPAVLVIHLDCSGVSCPILEISAAEVLPSLQCN